MSEPILTEQAGSGLDFTIRQFRYLEDYDTVLALWRTAGPGVHVGRSDTPKEILKKQARDPDLFLLAESGGELIGTVLGGFDGRRGIVYHLAVAQEARCQGVGTALMEAVEERLHAKGCLRSYLLVTPDNETAQHFYETHGWQHMNILVYGKNLEAE